MSANAAPPRKKKSWFAPVLIIVSLAMMLLLQQLFIFLLVAMMPTIASYYTDRTSYRGMFQCVMACNLSGTIPFFVEILRAGGGNAAVQSRFADPAVWFAIYAAAGAGWALIYLCPQLTRMMVKAGDLRIIMQLESRQKALVEDWGPEIKRRES